MCNVQCAYQTLQCETRNVHSSMRQVRYAMSHVHCVPCYETHTQCMMCAIAQWDMCPPCKHRSQAINVLHPDASRTAPPILLVLLLLLLHQRTLYIASGRNLIKSTTTTTFTSTASTTNTKYYYNRKGLSSYCYCHKVHFTLLGRNLIESAEICNCRSLNTRWCYQLHWKPSVGTSSEINRNKVFRLQITVFVWCLDPKNLKNTPKTDVVL